MYGDHVLHNVILPVLKQYIPRHPGYRYRDRRPRPLPSLFLNAHLADAVMGSFVGSVFHVGGLLSFTLHLSGLLNQEHMYLHSSSFLQVSLFCQQLPFPGYDSAKPLLLFASSANQIVFQSSNPNFRQVTPSNERCPNNYFHLLSFLSQ